MDGLGGLGRLARLWALLPLVAALGACDDFGLRTRGQGELRWIIEGSGPDTRAATADTRASAEIPDTNDFILKVSDAGGKVLYEGAYGESPESLLVDAGSYTVAVHSIEFTAPGFSRPVYGDEQVVLVKAGSTVTVRLNCILENAGVRLQVAPDFLTSYPDGVLYLKSGDTRLMYGYSEKRIAYFKPGPISLVLNNRGVDEVLLTRTLDARTILTLNLSAPHGGAAAASSITVAVDTAKVWNHESYVIGGGSGSGGSGSGSGNGSGSGGSGSGDDSASDIDNAYSVAQAHDHTGEDDVWVFGYIVGGDLSTAGTTVKTSKLTKSTHLAIASHPPRHRLPLHGHGQGLLRRGRAPQGRHPRRPQPGGPPRPHRHPRLPQGQPRPLLLRHHRPQVRLRLCPEIGNGGRQMVSASVAFVWRRALPPHVAK